MSGAVSTLVDRLRDHAARQPDAPALRFLDGDTLAADLTYAQLDARIRALAGWLQAHRAKGERALLLFPSGVEYVVAFNACLYAGLIAVPAYPPEPGRSRHAERLAGILHDAEPRFVLTIQALKAAVEAALPPGVAPRVVAVDTVEAAPGDWREGSPDPDSIAFLQYTSGSTSSPKGVRVSHANLDANERAFTTGFGMVRDDVFVSWLPLFHDMGLIGGLLQPLHLGIPAVLMAPKSFVERPRRWLEAFARFGGTVSGAPDFAYALCADRISEEAAAGLDLSSWRLAFNGAEFVRTGTLERFARRFAASGFSPKALFPCYGLAEATLFVTGGTRGEGAHVARFDAQALAEGRAVPNADGTAHVAVGHPPPGHALRIMREDGAGPAEPEAIGEIWVCGKSVADGYWRNPEATAAAFVRHEGATWLRTGDLGFLREGRLYVTGRAKDMIIIRGQNHFPQDIEQAVEAEVEVVRKGRVAAFPVEVEGSEGIGIAAEFGRGIIRLVKPEQLHDALAQAVVAQSGEAPSVVVLLNPRGMPLTTSGKLQRSACAAHWADGGLDAFATFVGGQLLETEARVPSPVRERDRVRGLPSPERSYPSPQPSPGRERGRVEPTEAIVEEIWRQVLRVASVASGDDFFLLGGNSIAAAEVTAALRERLRVELELGAFFRHPTLARFAAHVAERVEAGTPALPEIVPVDRTKPIPLSHAQERLWFLWRMDPAGAAYNVAASLRLRGPLDAAALVRALDVAVARHEALRTTFAVEEGGAVQRIHVAMPVPLARVDAASEDALEALTRDLLARPFDLTEGPLLRASLVRRAPDEHVLLVAAHHIAIDGISLGVLVDELAAAYRGAAEAEPPAIQYADYAAWQRGWLAQGEAERQLAYWQERLGREHPVLTLHHDRSRPAEASHRGDSLGLSLEPRVVAQVRALAGAEGASTAMVLLAAYALLLHRFSGQHDIRVGVPTANRRLRPFERLIGFFVNTLVLPARIDERESFGRLLARTKASLVEALAHQDVPFERVVERLAPERSLAHNPLFQAKFNHMAEPRGFDAVAGLSGQTRIVDLAGSHFDLALDVIDGPSGLLATFNYATDLFERPTIEQMAAAFADILAQVTVAPEQPMAALVSAAALPPPETPVFPAANVLDLVRAAVATQGEATAVRDESGSLTYAELDARSDALAATLAGQGVGAEVPVALVVERSNAYVAGLLGVMKAGGLAVPLDPSWPEARLRDVIADAGIGLVLRASEEPVVGATGPLSRVGEGWGEGCDLSGKSWPLTLSLSRTGEGTCAAPGNGIAPAPHPTQAAYVIYTSGSTGRPKGVVVSHGALANYVQTVLPRLAPAPGQSWAMVSTVAADLGHTMLFGALAAGAGLHLFPRESAFEAERFAAGMRDGAIDVLKIVPSHLRGLLQADPSGDVLPRETLVLGGEACDPALVAEIRRLRPALRILNHYGPTETTVGVLTHAVGEGVETVPIGRPLANTSAHILDPYLNPVPHGVAGELFIGGAGLARGYRSGPAATAERFVPDPFGAPGARLYRTGDRARRDAAGDVHFLGRADDQVKLRGHRVEPGEIARVLAALDGVGEAAVVAQPSAGGIALVAYCTARDGAPLDPAALRARLSERLPEHMVPAHVVLLERLPLTANGKLDRKALPLPDAETSAAPGDEPEGEVEQAIADIWAQVLRRERVGAGDNFFELGGDSILSLQVIARLRKRGIKLSPKQIFDRQTVRALAAVATSAAPKAAASAQTAPAETIRLLPIQHRFFDVVGVDRHHWNQALLLAPRARLAPAPLAAALRALVARHEALRQRFTDGPDGRRVAIGVEPDPDILRHQAVTDAEALTQACAQAQASLDLASGRLVRALLAERPDGSQRLLLAIHHLAVDGVSWRILLDELWTAYGQAEAGEPIRLGVPPATHAAWAARLHALAGEGAFAAEMPFWLAQAGEAASGHRSETSFRGAEGEPGTHDLPQPAGSAAHHRWVPGSASRLRNDGAERHAPPDATDGVETLAETETVVSSIDADLTARLLSEAPAAYRTQVNDLLLAALLRALGRWTGRDDALVELEGHGREEVGADLDLSRTIGWFTTAFPVLLDGASAATDALIKRVKESLRAVPNRGLGYGLLRQAGTAAQRAALAAQAEPEITFNYLGRFDEAFGADAPFVRTDEDAGPSRSPRAPLTRPLVVDGEVRDGRLRLSWRFGTRRHERAAIERLAGLYAEALADIAVHCTSGAAGLTPSDVPLAGLDQGRLDAFLTASGLDPRVIEDVYALSPTQAGLLFHALEDEARVPSPVRERGPVEPAAATRYVNQIALTVEGFEAEALRAAWQAATRRHPALRTSIHWRGLDADPLQVVHRDPPLAFAIEDGTELAEADILAREADERAAGFDLACAPLQRVRLIRLGHGRHRLIWTSHHILIDGWSSARLLSEVIGGAGGTGGRYRDYIAWLAERDAAADEAFWRNELAPLDEPTLLADAFTAADSRPGGLATLRRSLAGEAFARLHDFARRERVTLNTLVQGAWALALRRLTGHDVVAFGATVAGRPAELAGAQETLGLFINTLPLVERAPPDARLGPWLRALQARNLALREHEHTPLQTIQRLAGRPGQPLFDTALVFENYPVDPSLRPSVSDLRHATRTNYPLAISVFAGPDGLDLRLDHDPAVFPPARAAMLGDALVHLLGALAGDPERRLGALGLAPEPAAAAPLPAEPFEPVHRAIARQARARPDAVALQGALTFAALDARANRLAHRLIADGIGRGAVVAVAMERGANLIVALLAVLKAGAAYLPLDTRHPPARLAEQIADSQARLVLADAASRPVVVAAGVATLDPEHPDLANRPDTEPAVALHPQDLAYVIYTSGSTGRPKGVAIPHGPLAMHARAVNALYGMRPDDRELHFAAIGFDIAHERWIAPLMAGAALTLSAGRDLAIEDLLATIADRAITTAFLPPFYVNQVAEALLRRGERLRLRALLVGGEAWSRDALAAAQDAFAADRIVNSYGPTETVVTPTSWPLGPVDEDAGPNVPIGSPVGARTAHVLDPDLQPVPPGATGELHLGGEGLARGYLGRPALTAERFVPDPFGPPGGRLYRTGDRVSRLADGALVYRGRVDDQVKIRGHRIEPAEVEARLLALPGVGAAAVVARPGPGGLRLVGYVAPPVCDAPAAPLDTETLRAALASALPDYMVPSPIVVLDALPLTANGKLDRRTLPEPEFEAAGHVPPRDATEETIAAIWREVLGLDRVGVTDDFFRVGGDSIQAIRVVSRLRERFDRPFTPRDLFERSTIAALARDLDGDTLGTASRLDALLAAFEDA